MSTDHYESTHPNGSKTPTVSATYPPDADAHAKRAAYIMDGLYGNGAVGWTPDQQLAAAQVHATIAVAARLGELTMVTGGIAGALQPDVPEAPGLARQLVTIGDELERVADAVYVVAAEVCHGLARVADMPVSSSDPDVVTALEQIRIELEGIRREGIAEVGTIGSVWVSS